MRPLPTAPIAAGSLIAGYAVVAASGSRPLGGVVLLAGGLSCVGLWRRRQGARLAARLGAAGLGAFILSHLLALALGPWPAVLICAAALGALVWVQADARLSTPPTALALRRPAR